jgi:hypothetical protein
MTSSVVAPAGTPGRPGPRPRAGRAFIEQKKTPAEAGAKHSILNALKLISSPIMVCLMVLAREANDVSGPPTRSTENAS